MENLNVKKSLKIVVKAIYELDQCSRYSLTDQLGSEENTRRYDNARKSLINILFSNGYELGRTGDGEYKLKKSTKKRELL